MSSKDVTAYIQSAPAEQRAVLKKLRTMIRRHLPETEESMSPNGFAVYSRKGSWVAGFATRAKGPMLYVMSPALLDRFDERLGKLRSGKNCIEWKGSQHLPVAELEEVANEILAEAAGGLS